jgi:hypothetical protein
MNKYFIIIIITAMSIGNAQAQWLNFGELVQPTQALIEEELQNDVFLLHTCYRLKDKKGRLYGWNNAEHFCDTLYSFAIKTQNGFYATDVALYPWIYDGKFQSQNIQKKFTPVVSAVGYRELGKYSYTPMTTQLTDFWINRPNMIYRIENSELGSYNGMSVYEGIDLKNAWMVWLYSERRLSSFPNCDVKIRAYHQSLTYPAADGMYEATPPPDVSPTPMGGVCIVPVYTELGEMSFQLVGMLGNLDGKWYMARINSRYDETAGNRPVATGRGGKIGGVTLITK